MTVLGRPALGGGSLLGDKLVRMVFFDESGTGKIQYEPKFVLAGVIVHTDKQWKAIENHLVSLMDKYCPLPWGDRPYNYCFHAQELYSGGKIFRRDSYPKERRWEALDELCAIPAKFDLPIVSTYVDRSETPDLVNAYRTCYIENAAVVEGYMRLLPDKSEVACVICEDLPEVRWWVQSMQQYQQHHVKDGATHLHAHIRDRLWLTRIVGQPHFEGKNPHTILQVADVCAFVIAAQMAKKPESARFFKPLAPMTIDKDHLTPGFWELKEPPA
jgi:hypothetical protein